MIIRQQCQLVRQSPQERISGLMTGISGSLRLAKDFQFKVPKVPGERAQGCNQKPKYLGAHLGLEETLLRNQKCLLT